MNEMTPGDAGDPGPSPRAPEINFTHARLLRQFEFDHLPPELGELSRPFHTLASIIVHHANTIVGEPEMRLDAGDTTHALRKLLEAKDAFIRAALS